MEGLVTPDNCHTFSGSCDRRIKKISVKQLSWSAQKRDDNRRIFASLRLVNGDRIGELQFFQQFKRILYLSFFIVFDFQCFSILSFALNLFKAISPQITKTYANNEIETHRKIVYSGSKMETYLIFFIMIPFLFRTEFIMHMWLGKVPSYAVEFAMCAVFISLTYALFEPIRTSVLATNKITKFMIVPEFFYLLVMPMGYFVSKIWGNPIMLIVVIVGMDILTCVIRTYYAVKVSPLSTIDLIKKVVFPSSLVTILDSGICYILSLILDNTIMGFIIMFVLNCFFLIAIIMTFGLNRSERKICYALISKIRSSIKKK